MSWVRSATTPKHTQTSSKPPVYVNANDHISFHLPFTGSWKTEKEKEKKNMSMQAQTTIN